MSERTVYCTQCAAPRQVSGQPGDLRSCPACSGELRIPACYQVFISHSSADAEAARAVCRALEGAGIPCWIAPRDIEPGASWAERIMEAITRVDVMVLLFSERSNGSDQVLREVERAVGRKVPLIPVMLESAPMSGAMEYFLSASHWLQATEPPLETHLPGLVRRVEMLLRPAAPAVEAREQVVVPETAATGVNPSLPPYPGPQPFSRDRTGLFFGRGEETRQILTALAEGRLLLLYAPSGAGKSSLLNTVVNARLTRQRQEVILNVRVVNALPRGIRPGDIRNIYTFSAICGLEPSASPATYEAYRSIRLAEYLAARPRSVESTSRVIVFDQFEELFVEHPERFEDRRTFFEELEEALAQDPSLRVVLSMRQEYIAEVEPFILGLSVQMRRVRLERLRVHAALEAITGPAATHGVRYTDGAAEEIVRQLSVIKARQFDGSVVTKQGEFVEPVHLQIVCERLWRSLAPGLREIRPDHLRQAAGADGDFDEFVSNVLDVFYETVVEQVAESDEAGRQGGYAEELIQLGCMKFVTATGTRAMVQREARKTGRLPNWVVEELEARHLVRAEERGGEKWYELAHDRLTEPVMKRLNPRVNELLYAADLLSTVLGKVTDGSGQQLRGYFALHPEILSECEPFHTQPGLFQDEAEFVFRASIATGERMREWALRLQQDYPSSLVAVLDEALGHPSARVRANAATLLGECLVSEVEGRLVDLTLRDPDPEVRGAAAQAMARLDSRPLLDRLTAALAVPKEREAALEALASIRAAGVGGLETDQFDRLYSQLDGATRRGLGNRVRRRRLHDGAPSLFYVAIPAMLVSAVFTAGVKWMPASVNWALCQASASVAMGLFHGAAAATVWGLLISLALTLQHLVFENTRKRRSLGNFLQTALFGAGGGMVSGWLVMLIIAGVFEMKSLQVAGWIEGASARFNGEFFSDLLTKTRFGWTYPLTGSFLGLGVAAALHLTRSAPAWRALADRAEDLSSWRSVRGTLGRLIGIVLPRAWPILLGLTLAGALAVLLITPGSGAPAWKSTVLGKVLCVGGDCLAQVFGGLGVVVGMLFGGLVMQVGIRVPPRLERVPEVAREGR